MTIYFPQDHTPDEWRAKARGSDQRRQESWERSDTDGFLSQWASQVMSSVYDFCASVAEKGCVREIRWLMDSATGEPVEDWRWVETRYGSSVLIPGEGYGNGTFFNPSRAKKGVQRLERDQAKGYHWGTVECEVVVDGGQGYSPIPRAVRKIGAPITVVEKVSADYED